MNIGDNLKAYRKKYRITQNELSDMLGIKQNTYSQYENNKRQPDIDTLVKLGKIFECTIEDLVGIKLAISNEEEFTIAINSVVSKYVSESNKNNMTDDEFQELVKKATLDLLTVKLVNDD